MTSRPDELEQFKLEIDLRLFAVDFGYQLDERASSPSGAVLRGADGSKIRITRGMDGHYVYWNAHDELDSGSIVDFLQKRTGANLGQVRQQLRPWIGVGWNKLPPPPLSCELPDLVPIPRDLAAVQAQADGMATLRAGEHPYLNGERGIQADLLADPRFSGRIRVDKRGNAAFLHINRGGVCGFELKNHDWTGFAKGGAKGLWASACLADDERLIFTEAAIDALSFAAYHGYEKSRFVSTSGQPSDEQMELARAAIEKHPSGEIVLAFDNDEAGDRLVERFTAMFRSIGRSDLVLHVQRPETRGSDWNDVVRREPEIDSPPPPMGLSPEN